MHPGKFDRGLISGDWNAKIAERIECIRRNSGRIMSRCVQWLGAGRNRRVRRNGQYGLTKGLEGAAGWRGQFVMRFDVLIESIRVNNHLVAEDLVLTAKINSITLA